MPDLSHKGSAQYWSEYPDPMIYRVITFMESVENWTLDGQGDIEEALDILGKELDDIERLNLSRLGHEELFIRLLANIKTGRGLRLLQAIDMVHPGSASKVLMHAEENSHSETSAANLFLKRNITFERLRLLARTFSESRMKMVERALEGEE